MAPKAAKTGASSIVPQTADRRSFDNSGQRTDTPGFYNEANVKNALQAMDIISKEFRKSEYKGTVCACSLLVQCADLAAAIELVNEPQLGSSSQSAVLYDYLSRAYAVVHKSGNKYAVTCVAWPQTYPDCVQIPQRLQVARLLEEARLSRVDSS